MNYSSLKRQWNFFFIQGEKVETTVMDTNTVAIVKKADIVEKFSFGATVPKY